MNKKELFKLNCGFYSESQEYSELEFITKKHENAIFNSDSAFFYHGLTDNIPKKYYFSTKRKQEKFKIIK